MNDTNEASESAGQEQPRPKKKIQILKRKVEPSDWVRIAVLLVVFGLLVWGAVKYLRYFGRFNTGDLVESGQLLKQFITVDYPRSGLLIMMFLEMLHVVLSFIPAGLIAFASGMIYGTGWGMVINIVGTAMGTAISFYLSRLLGRKVVTLFVKDKDMKRWETCSRGTYPCWCSPCCSSSPRPRISSPTSWA